MNCTGVREEISRLNRRDDLGSHPELSAHAESCQGCAETLRRHFALLTLLSESGEQVLTSDLAARVLSRLDDKAAMRRSVWRWAPVAALAVAALALGYTFGRMSAASAQPSDSMTATYQAAFTGQAAGSAELAYLDVGSGPIARSTP